MFQWPEQNRIRIREITLHILRGGAGALGTEIINVISPSHIRRSGLSRKPAV